MSRRNDERTIILKRQVSTQPEKMREFLDKLLRQSGEERFVVLLEVCRYNDFAVTGKRWLHRSAA